MNDDYLPGVYRFHSFAIRLRSIVQSFNNGLANTIHPSEAVPTDVSSYANIRTGFGKTDCSR